MVLSQTTYLNFLNEDAFLNPHNIASELKRKLTEDIIGREREDLMVEIKCFELFFRNGDLIPLMESIDNTGKKLCYPDISQFREEEFTYIEGRLKTELHPFPKSRYAHLLWIAKKHNSFGQDAIDAYRELASMYFQKSTDQDNHFHHFCWMLQCIHRISCTIRYEVEKCKSELLQWLKKAELPVTWKDNVLDIILDSPLYKQTDFTGLTPLMLSYINGADEHYFVKEKYLQSCLLLSQKEGLANNEIYNLLAENEISLVERREDDESGLILISSYQKAAYYFHLAKNETRRDEVTALYTQQKSKLRLKLFRYEFKPEHIEALNQEQNLIVDKMLSITEGSPLSYLVYNKQFLMSEAILDKEAAEMLKNSITYFANMQVYDLNNNAKQLNQDDKLAYQKFQNYSLFIQLSTIPILEKFFYRGVKTGKLCREHVLDFFNQTWLARSLQVFSSDEKPETFSWMQLLGPGLFELVTQLEAQIVDKNFSPNFLLSIDSLSIKIEGIIRDLARLAGKSVTKMKEGEAVEMNLEELLRDETIIKIFNENDILLWKYLLTKGGWNIRNNVSHAFYRANDYNRNKAMLLLFAIFRLCKYNNLIDGQVNT